MSSVFDLFRHLPRIFHKKFAMRSKCGLLLNRMMKYDRRMLSSLSSRKDLQTISTLNVSNSSMLGVQLKRRPLRKKKLISDDEEISLPGFCNVKAMPTAEEYNLESLLEGLIIQNLYAPKAINASGKSNKKYILRSRNFVHDILHLSTAIPDVIHAIPKYEVGRETRDIFFFREGTVVMWNTPELESGNIIAFLKTYEENAYAASLIHAESEMMSYTYAEPGRRSHLKDGYMYIAVHASSLDKYTFSNALSQSVKLGVWEASLDHYVDSIEFVTDDLKTGKKIKMSREQVLKKQGELFALRHAINLSSDLLDTPDFYWEKDELENLYQQTCSYFSIAKRTRVMNEKINHCVELVELLSSHLSDRHHIRLEWMIIILIVAEVAFEIIHFIDRYLEKSSEYDSTTHSNL